jgi:hypothetical protein
MTLVSTVLLLFVTVLFLFIQYHLCCSFGLFPTSMQEYESVCMPLQSHRSITTRSLYLSNHHES